MQLNSQVFDWHIQRPGFHHQHRKEKKAEVANVRLTKAKVCPGYGDVKILKSRTWVMNHIVIHPEFLYIWARQASDQIPGKREVRGYLSQVPPPDGERLLGEPTRQGEPHGQTLQRGALSHRKGHPSTEDGGLLYGQAQKLALWNLVIGKAKVEKCNSKAEARTTQ